MLVLGHVLVDSDECDECLCGIFFSLRILN